MTQPIVDTCLDRLWAVRQELEQFRELAQLASTMDGCIEHVAPGLPCGSCAPCGVRSLAHELLQTHK